MTSRKATAIVTTMTLALTAVATAQGEKTVRTYKSTPSELAQQGSTPEAMIAYQADLHAWLVNQLPEGLDKIKVNVALTERDRKDLETPHLGGSATPMRVGVVKTLPKEISFARTPAKNLRANRAEKKPDSLFVRNTDGTFTWATTVHSPGAVAIRAHFEDVNLPFGTELFFLNREGQAFDYAGQGPRDDGDFWSHSVRGDTAIVLIKTPDAQDISFKITEVAHVAIDFPGTNRREEGGIASFCTYNASCVENNACTSNPAVNDAEGAAAKMRWISGAFVNICSGALIADTDTGSERALFMTANHCISKNKDAKNLETFFLYTANCGTTNCPSSFGQPFSPPSTNGANVLATGSTADYTLMELDQLPPSGTTYLGWNSAPVAFTSGAALHRISHPSGAPQAYSQHAVDTNIGTCFQTDRGPWIYSDDVVGATEGGSSGSAVVNSSGQFVGQLTGCCPVGGGNCNDVCNGNNHTIDGALAHYYSAVEPILDPSGGGCTSNADCDDGDPCNGAETCSGGSCQNGTPPPCQNGDGCCPSGCTSSNDDDCGGGCTLGGNGDPCNSNADCCSNKCRNGTCRGN